MVDVFGDSSVGSDFNVHAFNTVKPVIIKTGEYRKYGDEIRDSYKLGFTPLRIAKRHYGNPGTWYTPIYCFNWEIYTLDEAGVTKITYTELSDDDQLLYWVRREPSDGDLLTSINGPPGPQGSMGGPGPQGKRGAAGATGPQGERGAKGFKGDKGDIGNIGPIGVNGPQGERGVAGIKGDTGDIGSTGPRGAIGPQGSIGATGPGGDKGDKGDKGEKGDPGDVRKDVATKSYVIDAVEEATSHESTFIASPPRDIVVQSRGKKIREITKYAKSWAILKNEDAIVSRVAHGFSISKRSRVVVYLHCAAIQKTQNVEFQLYSLKHSKPVHSKVISLPAGEMITIKLEYNIYDEDSLSIRSIGEDLWYRIYHLSRLEVTEPHRCSAAASHSFVIDIVEQATSHDCAFIASPLADTHVKGAYVEIKEWNTIKKDDEIAQVLANEFTISQQSRFTVYLHCQALHETQENIEFQIYSRSTGAVVCTKKITLSKGELVSVLLHYHVLRYEKLGVRIFGVDTDFEIYKSSRVEVTETHRWEAPELIIGNHIYPWEENQEIHLGNYIDRYNLIYITARKGTDFLSKTFSPYGMKGPSPITKWEMSLEGKVKLVFSGPPDGTEHRTLNIVEANGYKVYSMYGVRCK